jgi:hypothetical protein
LCLAGVRSRRQLAADKSAGGAALQRPCRLLLDVSSGLPTASPCALSPTARRGKAKLGELRHPNLQLQRAAVAQNSRQPLRRRLAVTSGSRNAVCLPGRGVIRRSFKLESTLIAGGGGKMIEPGGASTLALRSLRASQRRVVAPRAGRAPKSAQQQQAKPSKANLRQNPLPADHSRRRGHRGRPAKDGHCTSAQG